MERGRGAEGEEQRQKQTCIFHNSHNPLSLPQKCQQSPYKTNTWSILNVQFTV